jgi:hypothetical protein
MAFSPLPLFWFLFWFDGNPTHPFCSWSSQATHRLSSHESNTPISSLHIEGIFDEIPTNDVPAKLLTPVAELEAIVDFGNSNSVFHMVTPIVPWIDR